ncbi:MAG TPA: sigma-54 dependent transcriptional regulator [archaeon]|nr:sigma-54 dependent transcriptional regulator [archaeon]
MSSTLFIVEDDRNCIELLKEIFSEEGYNLRCFTSSAEALASLRKEGLPDLVLTDLMMPQIDGISLLVEIRKIDSSLPVIVMTAHGSIETAVEALKKGANDYITKPLNFEELRLAVKKTLEMSQLRSRMEYLNRDKRARYAPSAMLGEHERMYKTRLLLIKVASAPTTCVLLFGESGTGKNLAARIIHYSSTLADGPFVELSCAAFPASLLEAELFGFRKGSFTGATADKKGIIEEADGGTLFLDEIAEIPLELQTKLLSFLESKKLRRLGEVKEREVNARLIAATNQDLEELVDQGMFRKDLFFRINVVHCYLSPLRELGRDALLIAEKFIAEFNQQFNKNISGFTPEAELKLISHHWPGNVRELRNVIERAMLFTAGERLEAEEIQLAGPGGGKERTGEGFIIPPEGLDWEEHEKSILSQALKLCSNNQSRAARLLSISRDAFIYRLKKFHLY